MSHSSLRTLAVAAVALLALATPSVQAQTNRAPATTAKPEDARQREREKQRADRDARRYDKLKAFALNLYQTDIDFRDDVDDAFSKLQVAHSYLAFETNVMAPARPTVVHDGDRLRLQEGLYDNKVVADYINRVGQQLVPADSDKLFAFRLVALPTPNAATLSTGTIYISTGLVSLLDNEAQLAYVLAHEMAHAHLDHWKLKCTMSRAEEDFNKKEGTKRKLIGMGIGALVGASAGAAIGGNTQTAVESGIAGAVVGAVIGAAWAEKLSLDWDTVQENEADAYAFKTILNRNYDVREVRPLYAVLQQAVRQDQRVGLGFMSNKRRLAERLANADEMIQALKVDIETKPGKLTVTHPDFVRVMSTLKRDNGILAFYFDMFQLAKSNLEYARTNRPNDPAAHYYYGKVMKLVGRTDEDRKLADEAFQRAIQFDHRERNFGAHFYRALALIDQKNTALNPEIAKELQAYLMASIRFASEDASVVNALPANIDDMYDYLTEVGEVKWRPIVPDALKPAFANVSTERQRPESPLTGTPTAKPTTPVKKQ